MIITISGAACTGKTTLLDTLKSELSNLPNVKVSYQGELIRRIFSEKYSNKYKDFADLLAGDPKDIIDIHRDTAKLFSKIMNQCDLDEIMIFDRSPIDISIYLYLNLVDYLLKGDEELLRRYRDAESLITALTLDFLKHFPLLFYTRPFSKTVEQDGFRPQSLIDKRKLEVSLFDKEFLSLPSAIILPGNLEERIEVVKYEISDMLM